jgi:Chalcone isomerase-like
MGRFRQPNNNSKQIERAFFFEETTTMKSVRSLFFGLAVLACAATAQAEPVTLSGVRYEDSAEVRGAKLQLNGAGLRYKAVFKVYAAGLYLPKKAATPEEVLAMPGAKRMSVTMLREVDSSELGKLFSRGMEDNMDKSSFSKLVPGVMRMSQIFSDHKKLNAGETFLIDWVPGTGTVVTVKGVPQGEPFKEPEFFNALLRIWLGPSPADWKLKEALLGKPSA